MFVALALLAASPLALAGEGDVASGAKVIVADRVAVVVNDEIVLLSEVRALGETLVEQTRAEGRPDPTLSEMVDLAVTRVLVRQELAALGLTPDADEVERSLDEVARRNKLTRDQLRAEVEKAGMPWETYRRELSENVAEMKFSQAVLRPRVTISEDELRDAWRRATRDAPTRAHVQAIFLAWPPDATEAQRAEVIARAEALRAQARAGTSFVELSRANDQGPFGAQDGEMGTFGPGELVGDLDVVVQATSTGDTSAPIARDKGVFLLHVADRSATAGGDYEALKPKLQDAVFAQRIEQERVAWAQQARRRAAVRVLVPGGEAPR